MLERENVETTGDQPMETESSRMKDVGMQTAIRRYFSMQL